MNGEQLGQQEERRIRSAEVDLQRGLAALQALVVQRHDLRWLCACGDPAGSGVLPVVQPSSSSRGPSGEFWIRAAVAGEAHLAEALEVARPQLLRRDRVRLDQHLAPGVVVGRAQALE